MMLEVEQEDCQLTFDKKTKCKMCGLQNLSKYTSYHCKTLKISVWLSVCYNIH